MGFTEGRGGGCLGSCGWSYILKLSLANNPYFLKIKLEWSIRTCSCVRPPPVAFAAPSDVELLFNTTRHHTRVIEIYFLEKHHLFLFNLKLSHKSCRTFMKLYILTFTMQYTAARHEYCRGPYHRTHTLYLPVNMLTLSARVCLNGNSGNKQYNRKEISACTRWAVGGFLLAGQNELYKVGHVV